MPQYCGGTLLLSSPDIKHILVLGTVLGVLGNNKSQVNGHLINKQEAIVGEGVPEYDELLNG